MKEAAQRLRKAAANLEERVRFNQSSLSDAIEMLIGQAESAQLFLENKGPEQLSKVIKRKIFKKNLQCAGTTALIDPAQIDVSIDTSPSSLSIFSPKDWYLPWVLQLAVEFAKECERLIDQYVQRVTDHVLFKVGKCWPLSQAYNTTSAVICQQIFWPFVSRSPGIRARPFSCQ